MNLCLDVLGTFNLMSPTFKTFDTLTVCDKIDQEPFISTQPINILFLKYQALSLITSSQLHYRDKSL